MDGLMGRLVEASSLAGWGLFFTGVGGLLTSGGKDVLSWAQVCGGLGAVLRREKGGA